MALLPAQHHKQQHQKQHHRTQLRPRFWLAVVVLLLLWLLHPVRFQLLPMPDAVLGIAPAKSGYLLQLNGFIRNSPRPADPYPFPIPLGQPGPLMPLYSGGLTYPFYCQQQAHGAPLVDNQQRLGVAVYQADGKVAGYSMDCQHPSTVHYYRVDKSGGISVYQRQPLQAGDLLLRLELGTIHRFFYYLLMPVDVAEVGSRTSHSQWNGRLIYQFYGGIGIGFRQGAIGSERLITQRLAQLKQGYAVISSSANRTSNSYNFLLAEDTAQRVKRQFVSVYGKPVFTIGIGGSGGGIAQYLLAQNAPGLLDGAVALYSYPDMLSQTLYGFDCDLLQNYFIFRSPNRAFWQSADKRQAVEGLSVQPDKTPRFSALLGLNQLLDRHWPLLPQGAGQCHNAWSGMSSLLNNPQQGRLRPVVNTALLPKTEWSYWRDVAVIFGEEQNGFARSSWGNAGVQYGLLALKNGLLPPAEFVALNAAIGSWNSAAQQQKETFWRLPWSDQVLWFSMYGRHNISTPDARGVAARRETDLLAAERAYRYGQLFLGFADIPILDVRHYLDPELDMHHFRPSLVARQRLVSRLGDNHQQRIWVAAPPFDAQQQAIEVMAQWLETGREPLNASDRCFDKNGGLLAADAASAEGAEAVTSEKVFSEKGRCTELYPPFSDSRLQAGGNALGLHLACHKIPLATALVRGDYLPVDMRPYLQKLQQIFPGGVCDYQQPDPAMPAALHFPLQPERL